MITAFDELSSHLHTTFSALSTALAQNQKHGKTDTVYLALVLGPTIGAPKARVVLVLEGLEVKVWEKASKGPNYLSSTPTKKATMTAIRVATRTKTKVAILPTMTLMPMLQKNIRVRLPPLNPLPRAPLLHYRTFSQPSASAPASTTSRPLRLPLSPKSPTSCSTSQPYLAPKPVRTHAEEQQTLRAAERLLARTLVNANAESGGGMAVESGAALPP